MGMRPEMARVCKSLAGILPCVDMVIVEPMFLVPQEARGVDHDVCHLGEVFEELGRHVFIGFVVYSEVQGNAKHYSTVERHPCGTIGLL